VKTRLRIATSQSPNRLPQSPCGHTGPRCAGFVATIATTIKALSAILEFAAPYCDVPHTDCIITLHVSWHMNSPWMPVHRASYCRSLLQVLPNTRCLINTESVLHSASVSTDRQTHTYTHIHTHIHTSIHTYIHTHTHTYTHTHTHTYIPWIHNVVTNNRMWNKS
jgi:hypothetical protein